MCGSWREGGPVLNVQRDAAGLVHALRRLRKRAGISQQALAVRLGIALPTVSRWENGRSRPSPLAVEKIKGFLNDMGAEGHPLLEEFFSEKTQGKR